MHDVEGDEIYGDGGAEMAGFCAEENVELKNFTFKNAWVMTSQYRGLDV